MTITFWAITLLVLNPSTPGESFIRHTITFWDQKECELYEGGEYKEFCYEAKMDDTLNSKNIKCNEKYCYSDKVVVIRR